LSVSRIQSIDELLSLCREAIVALKEDRAFDVDSFGDAFGSACAQLESHNPISDGDPNLETYRTKLKELDRLRKQLTSLLSSERGEMLSKLSKMSRGRRGLDGYRAALEGDKRGHPRGHG